MYLHRMQRKNNVRIKELKDKKAQLLGNKKSLSLKLDILISSIESGEIVDLLNRAADNPRCSFSNR